MGVLKVRVGGQWVDLGASPLPLGPARRNLLDNSMMQVSQRGTATVATGVTAGGTIAADRWNIAVNTMGTYSAIVLTTTYGGGSVLPPIPSNCIYLSTTTADAAPAAGDYVLIEQRIEARDMQHLLWGTTAAKPVTLSGWVFVTVAGTYNIELNMGGVTRQASFPLTLNAGWNYFAHTFPGNTFDVPPNTNAYGLSARIWFGAGTTYTSGTWTEGWHTISANRAVGNSNAIPALNGRIAGITQWQLEVGDVATPLEIVDYATDLGRCRRCFHRRTSLAVEGGIYTRFGSGRVTAATSAAIYVPLSPPMRAIPTYASSTVGGFIIASGSSNQTVTGFNLDAQGTSVENLEFNVSVASGLTVGHAAELCANGVTTAYIDAIADL